MKKMGIRRIKYLIAILVMIITIPVNGQVTIGGDTDIDYTNPKDYMIAGITVSGIKYVDQSLIVMISGLNVGDEIEVPGTEITNAIKKLWDQGMFEEVQIRASKIQGKLIFLDIYLSERPKLSKFSFNGMKRNEIDNIRDDINLQKGDIVTQHLINRTNSIIKSYFIDKSFLNVEVSVRQETDTTASNSVILIIDVVKNNKVKIKEISFEGNSSLSEGKLKRLMKNTKQKNLFRIWKRSRYLEGGFNEDKAAIIARYNKEGHRDAAILTDSIYKTEDGNVNLVIKINEGPKYFFRNITWAGNTKYTNEQLNGILNIQRGDVYNQELLEQRLFMNAEGLDVSSLYLDDGYLFFNLTPVEIKIENDSIDLELRITEGKQAIIRTIIVNGNTRTNDYVILREIRTKPGELFSRADIIRTQQELAQLRYFNNQTLGLDYEPNPQEGTVDLEYQVEETSSDQIELSGGWGGGRVIGTLGVSFNNFSLRNIFKKDAWRPLPSGDGQKMSVRAQSYGLGYYNFSASFTEPWLGGKKPNAFTVTAYHSSFSNALAQDDPDRYSFKINGLVLMLGKRLRWPDDYFTLQLNASYQNYVLTNYTLIEAFNNGNANNLSMGVNLSRFAVDDPIFPMNGSELDLSLQFTPPYSLLNNKDYSTLGPEQKYKWIEYHKWKIKSSWYINLAGKLVLHTRAKMGFLGSYNDEIGVTPFERFYLGGDGLSGINQFDGREIIGMRGYNANNLNPRNSSGYVGGTIYNKYTMELRYPVSLNPMSTIYLMGYVEAGNAWDQYNKFNPFELRRTAGVGVRIFLPMFGLLGLDYAWGFDDIPGVHSGGTPIFHFSINGSID